ncbi:MAG: DUF433 domain-containing protein [Pseudomonadota bacterium]
MSISAAKSRKCAHPYIERKEGVCGGEPVIAGTRISVSLITQLERHGHSVDEIVAMYPHINHAQVYDALSFYYDNKEEIDKIISESTEEYWMDETKEEPWRK